MENKNLEKKEKLNLKKIMFIFFSVLMIVIGFFYSLCGGMIIIFGGAQLSMIPHFIFALGLMYLGYRLFIKFKK